MKDLQYRVKGSDNKEMLVDLTYKGSSENRKVVIFSHGFKGFKDWGCFPLVSRCFAEQNFVFVKFNFSHNGTTLENPSDFKDLESFGNNNFSKELYDLDKVISWICSKFKSPEITLLGHSRGGGISMLKASSDTRIKNVVSWALLLIFLTEYQRIESIYGKRRVLYLYTMEGPNKTCLCIFSFIPIV